MNLSGRILIIEDESSLRQTLTRILRQAGCEVTAAGDGLEALQRLTGSRYDLAYLDIHLPEMDGLQVLREIHRIDPQLPVVLFTAFASLETALEAIRLGAVDYLLKPLNPEKLIERTASLLEKQAAERRKRDIQAQIAELQTELQQLDKVITPPMPNTGPLSSDRFLKRGRLVVDLQGRRATFGEREITLPPAAFDYLVVLLRHAPDVVDYQSLVNEAQGYQSDRREAQELAKWHIHELRDALEPDASNPRFVLNVRGVGYRLVAD